MLALAFLLHIVELGTALLETDVKRCWGWCFPENVVKEFVPVLMLAAAVAQLCTLSDSYPSGFCCYEALQLEWKKLCKNSLARGGTG